jgi:hypothetical protein
MFLSAKTLVALLPDRVRSAVAREHRRIVSRQDEFLQKKCLIGSFHKTGTVLMRRILVSLCRYTDVVFWDDSCNRRQTEPESWNICFDNHSSFDSIDESTIFRLPKIIVIRDPRDIIISGAHYHCRANERWLLEPMKRFGGKTYKETIRALPDHRSRLKFEMAHTGAETIRRISAIHQDEAFKSAKFVKLEDLMEDFSLLKFHETFSFIGIGPRLLPIALEAAYAHSVFGGATSKTGHIRRAAKMQWMEEFDDELLEEFNNRFAGVAEALGYPAGRAAARS